MDGLKWTVELALRNHRNPIIVHFYTGYNLLCFFLKIQTFYNISFRSCGTLLKDACNITYFKRLLCQFLRFSNEHQRLNQISMDAPLEGSFVLSCEVGQDETPCLWTWQVCVRLEEKLFCGWLEEEGRVVGRGQEEVKPFVCPETSECLKHYIYKF